MTGRNITLQCVYRRKAFLWGLAFAFVLCTRLVWPAWTNAATLPPVADTEAQSFNDAIQGSDEKTQSPMSLGMGMQPPMRPDVGMPPPGPPPGMSPASYSNEPSEITAEGVIALALNAVILCSGVAFALLYHRGRKSF